MNALLSKIIFMMVVCLIISSLTSLAWIQYISGLNKGINNLNEKIINIENGVEYLYAKNEQFKLTTTLQDRNGKFPVGSYNDKQGMILITNNLTNYNTCYVFIHELGHKVCYPDLTEDCANKYREQNKYRCEGI